MNGLPYYKRYPRDFIEGTIGLGLELKTAYAFLLDLIYMQGGNLPDEPRYISGLLECSIRKWKSLRQSLIEAGKITVSGEFLTNYRAVSELETLAKLSRKQSENASGPRKTNDLQKPRQNHTDTDTDTKKKNILDDFEKFWRAYPKRKGGNPKHPASLKFNLAAKNGAEPSEIIEAAKEFAASERTEGREGTEFVPQAVTWLNQRRWEDFQHQPGSGPPDPSMPSREELLEHYGNLRGTEVEADYQSLGEETPGNGAVLRGRGEGNSGRVGTNGHQRNGNAGSLAELDGVLHGEGDQDAGDSEGVGEKGDSEYNGSSRVAGVVRRELQLAIADKILTNAGPRR